MKADWCMSVYNTIDIIRRVDHRHRSYQQWKPPLGNPSLQPSKDCKVWLAIFTRYNCCCTLDTTAVGTEGALFFLSLLFAHLPPHECYINVHLAPAIVFIVILRARGFLIQQWFPNQVMIMYVFYHLSTSGQMDTYTLKLQHSWAWQ